MKQNSTNKSKRPPRPFFAFMLTVLIYILYLGIRYFGKEFLPILSPLLLWVVGCVTAMILLRNVFCSTGYQQVLKNQSYFVALIDQIFSLRFPFVLVVSVTELVLNCRAASVISKGRPILEILISLICIIMECTVHEHTVRGIYTESLDAYCGHTKGGMAWSFISSSFLSATMLISSLWVLYGIYPTIEVCVMAFTLELWISQSAEIPSLGSGIANSRKGAVYQRIVLMLPLLAGYVFYYNNPAASTIQIRYWYMLAMLLISLIRLLPNQLSKISGFQIERIYQYYGSNIPYWAIHQKKQQKDTFLHLRVVGNQWQDEYESNSYLYFMFAVVISVVIISAYRLLLGYFEYSHVMSFVHENGVEILSTQTSVTFLLTSFLSFLSDRNDLALWTDTMEYKLVAPRFFNFISLAVYAFTTLFFAVICYFLSYDFLVLVFFIIGLLFLIVLTFTVIDIYFHRSGILLELERAFYEDIVKGQKQKINDLYHNTCHVIQENDYKRINENFRFLIGAYRIHMEFLDDLNLEKQIGDHKLVNDKLHLYLKYTQFSQLQSIYIAPEFERIDRVKEIKELVDILRREIIFFTSMILRENSRSFIKMIDPDTAVIMSIPEVRTIISTYIRDRSEEPYLGAQLAEAAYNGYTTAIKNKFYQTAYMVLKAPKITKVDRRPQSGTDDSLNIHMNTLWDNAWKIGFCPLDELRTELSDVASDLSLSDRVRQRYKSCLRYTEETFAEICKFMMDEETTE